MIKKISEDTIYLTNDKEPTRLRPIQKDLLNEFVEYYSNNPDRLSQRFPEDREIIRDSENAKFDKFVYGYDATLKVLPKRLLNLNMMFTRTKIQIPSQINSSSL